MTLPESITAVWQDRIGDWMESKKRDHAGLHRVLELGQMVHGATALIHEVQRERGLSSGFVASSGTQFAAELEVQRLHTDGALGHALEGWSTLHEDRLPAPLVHTLATVRERLSELELLRIDVSTLSIPTASTLERFTGLIECLFLIVAEAPGSSPHPKVTMALIALFHFVLAKEHTGRERALGSAICSQGEADPHSLVSLGRIRRQRTSSLDVFLSHASLDQWSGWVELAENPISTDFQTLGVALEAFCRGTGKKVPSAELWFEKATLAIDQFRSFEIRLLNDLDQLCLAILSQARAEVANPNEEPVPPRREPERRVLRDLQRLEQALTNLDALVSKVRILALDASIEAIPRIQVSSSAKGLFEALDRDLSRAHQAAQGARQAFERTLDAAVPEGGPK